MGQPSKEAGKSRSNILKLYFGELNKPSRFEALLAFFLSRSFTFSGVHQKNVLLSLHKGTIEKNVILV